MKRFVNTKRPIINKPAEWRAMTGFRRLRYLLSEYRALFHLLMGRIRLLEESVERARQENRDMEIRLRRIARVDVSNSLTNRDVVRLDMQIDRRHLTEMNAELFLSELTRQMRAGLTQTLSRR
jgi:hypothetical protein